MDHTRLQVKKKQLEIQLLDHQLKVIDVSTGMTIADKNMDIGTVYGLGLFALLKLLYFCLTDITILKNVF